VNRVKREFSMWASHRDACDAIGINNFYELQQLMLTSWLTSGDVFALIQQGKVTPMRPYSLRIRALEADLVATPTEGLYVTETAGKNPANGNRIYDGVEVDSSGRVVAYHIRSTYPYEQTVEQTVYKRIEAYGKKSGEPNILHLMSSERPGQYRGVSIIAPVIVSLLQVNRYTEAELTAAIVNSMFTAYVQINVDQDGNPLLNEAVPEGGFEVTRDPNDYEMGPGQVNFLQPGENVVIADPKHPTSSFDAFISAVCTQIGAALEIPKEILLKQFTASYSASRGALLEAWKSFRMYRTWFVNDFCNPVYELWLSEAVARGRIEAPGFFTDPAAREAWLSCQWIGPSQGMLDPQKEIAAEVLACANGFSTHEDSALRLNGSDFSANVEQLEREAVMMEKIAPAQMEGQEETEEPGEDTGTDTDDDTEDDSDDKEGKNDAGNEEAEG
jgi:lambda family phage portal protein